MLIFTNEIGLTVCFHYLCSELWYIILGLTRGQRAPPGDQPAVVCLKGAQTVAREPTSQNRRDPNKLAQDKKTVSL